MRAPGWFCINVGGNPRQAHEYGYHSSTEPDILSTEAGGQAISAILGSRPRLHEGKLCAGTTAAS